MGMKGDHEELVREHGVVGALLYRAVLLRAVAEDLLSAKYPAHVLANRIRHAAASMDLCADTLSPPLKKPEGEREGT